MITHPLIRRAALAIPALLLLPLITITLLEIAPGDAALTMLDSTATMEQREAMRSELGLTGSALSRYIAYLGGLLRGDMGLSIRTSQPVTHEVAIRLPYTLALLVASVVLGTASGALLGAAGAYAQGGWDRTITALITLGTATPTFWLALILSNIFALNLGWLPVFGAESPAHLILPAICTAFALVPGVARLTRTGLLEVTGRDFIRTAQGKGLRGSDILRRHIAPHAAISVVAFVGMQSTRLIGMAAVMEVIFGWPGLGGLAVSAAFDRDPALLMGAALAIGAISFLLLTLSDLIILLLDPRIGASAEGPFHE